jgi:hypothetical protein
MTRTLGRFALALSAAAGLTSPAMAQLRVANWNVSTYPSTTNRDAYFQTSIYGVFNGRSMSPDIIACEEFVSAAGQTSFRTLLNTAPGSPGDWNFVPWISGTDTQSTLFYRTSKIQYISSATLATGAASPSVPRNINVFTVRLVGYSGDGATIAIFPSHMKSSDTTDDRNRRLLEAQYIRGYTNGLPSAQHFIYTGDTNIPSSSQDAYQELVTSPNPFSTMPTGAPNNSTGQFFDPIKSPGSWQNNSTFKFLHTQAPGPGSGSTGGMDDRFDQILLDAGLLDGKGFEYIGNASIPYSTTTWNDPNHSFRAWGQDGTCFNTSLTVTGNAMVGATIAQALVNTTVDDAAGGHLPVFLDLRVPGKVSAPALLNLGSINQNAVGQTSLSIANGADVSLWTAAGISNLQYTLAGSSGVTAPSGTFSAAPGAPSNNHTISIDTSVAGPFSGTVTIQPTDSDTAPFPVTIQATIVAPATCYANCDQSTEPPVLNVGDFTCFLQKYAAGDPYANCDGSTQPPVLNVNDFTCFLQAYAAGCP